MRYVRRLIAILTGCATWCVAAATVAYARPDPGGGVIIRAPADTAATGTALWQIFAVVALGVLLVLAVAGLVYSLMHRRSERSRTSEPSGGLRA
jgi:hypothetical protein